MAKVLEFLKKGWVMITALIIALVGAFLIERNKRKDAEVKLLNTENDKETAVLDAQKADIKKQVDDATKETEAEKAKKLTEEQMAEELMKI
jgi:flagellar biosynthesis/type III secretory pathway M-ring protein FliF/YscJ